MATYFVRKNGNDANSTAQAQDPATAWLTIDKAANEVAAADTVVVGAGVYRELVTMDTAGTSGNIITYVADVDGALGSGDPGLIIISAYDDELSTASRNRCLHMAGKEFITWRGFIFTGGTSQVIGDAGAAGDRAYEEVTFEDCVIVAGHNDTDNGMFLDLNQAATPATAGLTIRRCVFSGARHILIDWVENASAEIDAKITVDSCMFYGHGKDSGGGLFWQKDGIDTFSVGGVAITNCTFYACYFGVWVSNPTPASPTQIVDVNNCFFYYCHVGLNKDNDDDGMLIGDYNTYAAMGFPYVNVTAGGNDRANTTDPGLVGGLGDYPLYRFWGWSPFRPWEPIRLQDDAYIHSVIGDGDTSVAPVFDLYDEPRPMYGTVDDRGAVEGRARPERETTTTRTGSNAIRFEGAGWHDMFIPVGTSLTTVDVYAQFDATYAGTLPQLQALNIPGVADQTDIQTGSSGSWEKLTVTFTATSDGIARIRFISSDTSAGGECFFDDLAVS